MCIIPGLRVELLDKHSDGRKAFKASVNALSGFRVMNTGEGPSHDDLTGIPEKPTLREMVGKKDDCLQRIPNRISATLFDNRLAVDAERNPDLGQIEAVPIGA